MEDRRPCTWLNGMQELFRVMLLNTQLVKMPHVVAVTCKVLVGNIVEFLPILALIEHVASWRYFLQDRHGAMCCVNPLYVIVTVFASHHVFIATPFHASPAPVVTTELWALVKPIVCELPDTVVQSVVIVVGVVPRPVFTVWLPVPLNTVIRETDPATSCKVPVSSCKPVLPLSIFKMALLSLQSVKAPLPVTPCICASLLAFSVTIPLPVPPLSLMP